MTGAMYAGISGMRAHMNKLNVIGNNVANVNTAAYKAGFTVFHESLYSTTRAGANGTATAGGVNPIQTGYGCKIASVGLDMSTKNYMPTGNPMDCMIDGDGFFMVGDKNAALPVDPASMTLTRVGTLQFDNDGYLTDGNGGIVYGFLRASDSTSNGAIASDGVGEYNHDGAITSQTKGVSTQLVPIRLPIAAGAPKDTTKDPAQGTALYPTKNKDGKLEDKAVGERVQLNSVSIGKNGELTGVNEATGEPVVVGYIAMGKVENPNGVTHMGGPYYKALGGAGQVSVSSMGGVVKGSLNDPADDTAAATGKMILTKGKTILQTSGLESSGADVATEFSEMITTQRGYQASTRIITVTDSMLEELVNIKR